MRAGGLPARQYIRRISSVRVLVSGCRLSRNQTGLESKESKFECKKSNLTGEISEKLIVKLGQEDESKSGFWNRN